MFKQKLREWVQSKSDRQRPFEVLQDPQPQSIKEGGLAT